MQWLGKFSSSFSILKLKLEKCLFVHSFRNDSICLTNAYITSRLFSQRGRKSTRNEILDEISRKTSVRHQPRPLHSARRSILLEAYRHSVFRSVLATREVFSPIGCQFREWCGPLSLESDDSSNYVDDFSSGAFLFLMWSRKETWRLPGFNFVKR